MAKKTEELSCVLTEAERNERAAQAAMAIEERLRLDAEKSAFNAAWKERSEELSERTTRLASASNSGTEMRDVEITEKYNRRTKRVDVYRDDTGKKLYSRDLEPHERQVNAFEQDDGDDHGRN